MTIVRRDTFLLACVATLLASNAQAVSFPAVPLESGAQYPPANVRFILDDSGSMNFVAMPADIEEGNIYGGVPTFDADEVTHASYAHNTLYYNPTVDYEPWMTADGETRLPDASYSNASDDTDNLTDYTDLNDDTQTFYVPKVEGTTSTSPRDFWRYQILDEDWNPASARGRIVKSEWKATGSLAPGFPKTGLSNQSNSNAVTNTFSFTVPAGTARLTVILSGGEHGTNNPGGYDDGGGSGADLRVDDDSNVGSGPLCSSSGNSNEEVCSIVNPAAMTWYAGIARGSRYRDVTMYVYLSTGGAETGVADVGCSTSASGEGWRNCVFELPNAERTLAQEKANFANWYTYHRTRMKVAKAGASEAFSRIGENLRIGFDSINRSTAGIPLNIPVNSDDGLFRGSNKEAWYDILHTAVASGGTPLHRGLQRAGLYFSDDSSATSPWRNSDGDIIACRQNFAILTTDGYWNSDSNYAAIGDADGEEGPTHTSTKGVEYTYVPDNPYTDDEELDEDHRTDTLADVAMHYWKNDLTDLPNNVPTSADDPAFWQHMVTFGVSIGLEGDLPFSDTTLDAIRLGTTEWTDPRADIPNDNDVLGPRIDDLWHASVNGRGDFVIAADTEEFSNGLFDAFQLVAARQGSASNVTANSTSFTDDTRVFQASYDTARWSGELKSYDATAAGVGVELWAASAALPATREFYTWDADNEEGALFPTDDQTAALDQSSRPIAPVSGDDNVAYLKGTRTLERGQGGDLRARSSPLGDIVNSSPFYVADTDTIYVGANDGMLHAFEAQHGVEQFAYVPGGIDLDDLASLSSPGYIHKFFVDGPVVVTTRAQTPSHNYLIGALGRGGRGLFGLDVTDPAGFDEDDVLWELTHADLGNVLGEPLIATLNGGGGTVAIVGNGLNSDNGHSVLFVIDIQTGAVLHRLDTGEGGDNGLFAPRGWDNDANGTVDFVYAGDRNGNLWKFDFTGATPVIDLGGEPLFTTASGQPITTGVALAKDPATGKRWVFVGTGSYMVSTDPEDDTVQSIYGLIDNDAPLARTDLEERDIRVVTTLAGNNVRGFEPNATLPGSVSGWYVDLDDPTEGERIVTRPQVRGSVLVFASRIPPTDNTCDAGGSGYLNALDAFSGTSTSANYFDGDRDGTVDGDDSIADGDDDLPVGSIDLGVDMPTQPTIIDQLIVVGGSEGELASIRINPLGGAARRASWREIEGD